MLMLMLMMTTIMMNAMLMMIIYDNDYDYHYHYHYHYDYENDKYTYDDNDNKKNKIVMMVVMLISKLLSHRVSSVLFCTHMSSHSISLFTSLPFHFRFKRLLLYFHCCYHLALHTTFFYLSLFS